MRIADKNHKEILERILTEGFADENPRPRYADGTPAHTLSVNHVVTRYDLSRGECPIITLRPIAWKSSVKEILWIYRDMSNSLDTLENVHGIYWWRDWESKDMPGTIGIRYGATVKKHDLIRRLLKDIAEFGAMNAVYAEFFSKPYPARAAFQVAALPKDARVEIEAVAVIG